MNTIRKLFSMLNEEIGDNCNLHMESTGRILVSTPSYMVMSYFVLAYNIASDLLSHPEVNEEHIIATFTYNTSAFTLELK